jgi:cobalt/nickel transport system permease protein
VHIPDGFLKTPVWASLDVVVVPALAIMVRRAQRGFAEARAPLLGVMGAFVFGAQMINFPVGVGTSGHLVGGALLAYTLGPAAASVVMTAILAIQALVFQDGGILALGANFFNMAIAGVLVATVPYRLFGAGRGRTAAIFTGAMASVLVSALLALSELAASGVRMPLPILALSLALFVVSASLEGAITVAVIQALEKFQPDFIQRPSPRRGYALAAIAGAAVFLAVAGFLFASTAPDGLERLTQQLGIASHTQVMLHTPLSDYQAGFAGAPWLRKSVAGLAGITLIFAACSLVGWSLSRKGAQ